MTEEPPPDEHRADGGTTDRVPVDIADQSPRAVNRTADDTDAVEPVELLVQLAKEDEIEPWDIDIVAVTDKFLAALDEPDLRTGGRALFYASVLLRLKSDAMLEEPTEESPDDDWAGPMDAGGFPPGELPPDGDPFAALESEIDRRIERKRARGIPSTLDELVRELRDRERWWKASRKYDTSNSPRGYARGTQSLEYRGADDLRAGAEPTEAEVTGATHKEDIEAVIDEVENRLWEQFDAGRVEVLFDELVDVGSNRVEIFLAVLFLAHRGQVQLRQDELFGDLWIQDPTALSEPDEAVAD